MSRRAAAHDRKPLKYIGRYGTRQIFCPALGAPARPGCLDPLPGVWSNPFVSPGRVLAVDYGTKNVGLARCDDLGVTVMPLASVPNTGRRNLLARLKAAAEEHDIGEVVVGMPWNLDGSAGPAVAAAERLIDALRAELGVPVRSCDERLSTLEALERWRGLTPRQQKRFRTVDSLAAALILERFLAGE